MNLQTTYNLRKRCKTSNEREPCFLCGEHMVIVEQHHVFPLSELTVYVNLLNLDEVVEPPKVWLCPNCHSYIHKMLGKSPMTSWPEYFDKDHLETIFDMKNSYLESLRRWIQCKSKSET